jgi:salicylate hydroxylase
MTKTDMSVAIIGGGIGGIAAALALLNEGIDVHVFEQTSALAEVGAGIQISANASSILHRLGLERALGAQGVKPLAWHQRRWDNGQTLLRTPLGSAVEAAFGAPHYQIHRADLLAALADALPAERLHLGHQLRSVVDHTDHAEAIFENGTRVRVDAIIGADGIHSSVRQALFGPDHPNFTGCVAYRGLVSAEKLRHLDLETTAQIWMGPGQHFVHYFVRNRELVNFVAVVEQSEWRLESWTEPAEVVDALEAFSDWNLQVREILGAADRTFRWALFDRPPMQKWGRGRIALLGDACHAMLPFFSQGAAQAIEDGATLASCLRSCSSDEVPAALQHYARSRLPRVSKVQAMSSGNKTRFHLPDGDAQRQRDAEMATGGTDWSLQAAAWLYGHDATILLDRPRRAHTAQ